MRFLALFWGCWKILTRVLSSPSSSVSDLVLLLLFCPSSLRGCSVLLPRHRRLNALLPSISLPSVPYFVAHGCLLGPGTRPADGALFRVAVEVPCGDHFVASLLNPIAHTARLDVQYEPPKNQFAKEPEGLR